MAWRPNVGGWEGGGARAGEGREGVGSWAGASPAPPAHPFAGGPARPLPQPRARPSAAPRQIGRARRHLRNGSGRRARLERPVCGRRRGRARAPAAAARRCGSGPRRRHAQPACLPSLSSARFVLLLRSLPAAAALDTRPTAPLLAAPLCCLLLFSRPYHPLFLSNTLTRLPTGALPQQALPACLPDKPIVTDAGQRPAAMLVVVATEHACGHATSGMDLQSEWMK